MYFSFSVHRGDRDGIYHGRYFHDYNRRELQSLMEEYPELEVVDIWTTQDVRSEKSDKLWLNVLATKNRKRVNAGKSGRRSTGQTFAFYLVQDIGGKPMGFTHLHVHTEYSLLDGSNKIKEYVARVKELGMDSAAITDHGVMYGCIDFYRAAKEAGINPILGCEVYVAPGSRFDKEMQHGEDRYYHLVLLAENNQGYSNLMKIVSAGFVEGYYYKPRVDLEVLEKYHEGIIALSACLAGEIPRFLTQRSV